MQVYPKLLILCRLFDRVIDKQSQPFPSIGDCEQKPRFEVEKRLFLGGRFYSNRAGGLGCS
ncbi:MULTISPECIES: hypothetical protein [unclassified Microcoleus]|uniref:hypothetical protein n=1 Tax=unclassified Microcoleus TaxID=2642155 RepID=UPI002FD06135